MLRRYRRYFYSQNRRTQILTFLSVGIFLSIIAVALLTTVVFAVFSLNLPDPNKIVRRDGYSTIIYDRNGKVLYDLYDKENRIPLQIIDIPKYLQEATVSTEDKNFYKNTSGFDMIGMARAIRNILLGGGLQSGSTITQQLVKNTLLTSQQSVVRKIREVILAYQIDHKFSKDQILQMYLNEAPYGGAYYGVESAARGYFGVSAKDLNLVQSAILAGMPQAPTIYSPFGETPKAYVGRATDVLRRMREDGYITVAQEQEADKELPSVQFASPSAGIKAPHFIFYVKDQLVSRFGEQMVDNGGLRVTTTLDWDLEQQAEKIVHDEVLKIKPLKVTNGAAVILDPRSGEILSMVGSYDYFDKDFGSYNIATALRQPGSSGKPFIYATAFTKGYTPASMIMDVKTDYPTGDPTDPTYTPVNYDGKYRGPMQLRFALGNSINTVAVKLTALAGLKDIMQNGYNAGISTWNPTPDNLSKVGLSLALGGREVRLLELTSAYGVFATGGIRNDPVAILKVEDSSGNQLYQYHQVDGRRIFSPEVSYLISHVLSDNNARSMIFGPYNLLQVSGKTVAVKTGTTDLKRDNWAVGYTPSRVIGVWVGNNDNSIMDPRIASGITGATPIWHDITVAALKNLPNEQFTKPDGVIALQVDTLGGGLPHNSDPTRSEYFIKGTEPTSVSPIYKTFKIAPDGKLANDLQIKTGSFNTKEFIVFNESDPVSSDGKNRWQDGINAWVNDNHKDDPIYHPPTETSSANSDSVVIQITQPGDHQNITTSDGNVEIKAQAVSAHDITNMTLKVDGNQLYSGANNSFDKTVNMSNCPHSIDVSAADSAGNNSDSTIHIGVNVDWSSSPSSSCSAVLK